MKRKAGILSQYANNTNRGASRHFAVAVALTAVALPLVGLRYGLAADTSGDRHLKALYDAHNWSELGIAVSRGGGSALFRGAVAEMFNDPHAETLLRSVIRISPRSGDAYEAYEWLSHLYLRTGRYAQLTSVMQKCWTAFPEKESVASEQSSYAPFQGLPDQTGASSSPVAFHHDGTIFVPISVNGNPAKYFFDTGAWLSSMSESEAVRLGLEVHQKTGSIGTAAGSGAANFRMAVAKEVMIAGARFQNVSFAVFPDKQEPWSQLAPGQRGIIGVPLLLGCIRLRWANDGTVAIGGERGQIDIKKANLYFDDDHLVLMAGFQGKNIRAVLDTGATTTDLYAPFADQFASLVKEQGIRESKEIRGVGHAETFESFRLPALTFEIGGLATVLRPAHIILKDIGPKCCIGNFGLDLLKQGRAFEIDFGRMTLRLEPER